LWLTFGQQAVDHVCDLNQFTKQPLKATETRTLSFALSIAITPEMSLKRITFVKFPNLVSSSQVKRRLN